MRAATIAELVRLAARVGVAFRLRGARTLMQHIQLSPPDLVTELHERRDELWAYLGGPEQDQPSLDLLAQLGVRAVVPQDASEALALLSQIEADSERGTPAGLIGLDIETMANPGEEVRQCARIGRNGQVTSRPALDPLQLRRPHKPQSSAGLDPRRSRIRLAQLYGGGDVCMVLDTYRAPLTVLAPLLQRRKLVIHNAAFELAFLHAVRGNLHLPETILPRFECTMQAAGLLLGTHRRALDDVAFALLGIELPKQLQTSDWGADTLSPGQIAYAALDAIIALRLWRILRRELIAQGRGDAYLLQRDAIPAAVRMQARGMLLDQAAHRAWMDARSIALHDAKAAMTTNTGLPSPTTPAQQRAYLELSLTAEEKAAWPRTVKTGQLSTADAELKRRPDILGIQPLRDMKSEEKALSTFGAILAARAAADGRIHAFFNIGQAKTGRMSSSSPNMQQIPRAGFRHCFIAAPGNVLVSADYTCMELRAVAEVADDPVMRADFANYGKAPGEFEPHRLLAAAINKIVEADVTALQRQGAKPINFGTIYGAGPAGLAASAWSSYDVKLPIDEAAEARDLFFSRYRTLQGWMRSNADACQQRGIIPIGRLGRVIEAAWEAAPKRRPQHAYDDNGDSDDWDDDTDIDAAELWSLHRESPLRYTLCCNAPVQGACADVTMRAMILVDHGLTDSGITGGLVLALHDEFLLEVPEAQAAAAAALLERCMTQAFAEHFPNAPLKNLVEVKLPSHVWEAKL